jgi:hypothetical protein
MVIRVLYIDDDEKELKKYDLRFTQDHRTRKKFRLITRNSPKIAEDYMELLKIRPELILVDFDLSKPDKNGKVIGISGVTLSTELRQKFPEDPIVLFTRKSVFKVQNYMNIKQTLASIDDVMYKRDLFEANSNLAEILYELAVGFRKLRNSKSKRWKNLLKLIGAPESDYDKLKLADPPIFSEKDSNWSVSKSAKWIRDTLIAYPGILYDSIHAATLLGISENAFLKDSVQQFFHEAKYAGIFSPSEGRWWKSKIIEIASSKMKESESSLVLREGFPLLWKRIKKGPIERSKCIFSGESPAEWVCYILKKPVMIKYSLYYKPDSRPSVMDEARVSFEAIRISNEVNDALIDPIGQELLPKIRKMDKRSVK